MRQIYPIFILALSAMLCSCNSTSRPYLNRALTGATVGAASGAAAGGAAAGAGAVMGALIGYDMQRKIPELFATEERLAAHGANIIKLGETIKVVLPADEIFIGNSPRILASAEEILRLLNKYIAFFHTVRVQVSVFSDNHGGGLRNDALTKQRAEDFIDYLWRGNMDTRLLVAKGFGSRFPIASNHTAKGRFANRRVEISFRIYNTEQMFVA